MKKLTSLLFALLLFLPGSSVQAQEDKERVIDNDNLISDTLEAELETRLDAIADEYDIDVVILTEYSIGGIDGLTYANTYYDENNLGIGEDNDGILFVLSLEFRDWGISTEGFGDEAFNNYALDKFEENILSEYSNGNYDTGFSEFVDMVEIYVKEAKTNEAYYYDHEYREWTYYATGALGVIVISLVVALIYLISLRKDMVHIRQENEARNYVKDNSFVLLENTDKFLYAHTSKTRIQRNTSSGGRSGGGGRSSGGRGGKF